MDSGPNWSKAKAPLGEAAHDLLYPIQFRIRVGVGALLPGTGALEGDVVGAEQLPYSFPADHDGPVGVGVEVVGQLAQAPVGEGPAQLLGSRLGGLDDEGLV